MGMLDPNTLIGIIEGKVGNLVFVRTKDGRVIVRGRPVRQTESTLAERAGQQRLVSANAYVRSIRQQPDQYAPYQEAAKASGKRACDLAKADYAHPPVIHDVDVSHYTGKPGEPIGVVAVDDFGVVSVYVTLTEVSGALIEHGSAVLEQSRWVYLTQAAVVPATAVIIHVTALDRPGNAANKTLQHALIAP
jgi:hypothetical protein